MDIKLEGLVRSVMFAISGPGLLRRMTALFASLVLCSNAHAGYGYFQVDSDLNTYCPWCSPPLGSASNPVLDDGKTVVYLQTFGGYLKVWISGFSSDPGAGYLQYLQIDG